MGYMHIDNLYKDQQILLFKKCYALEKVHGTSAHIAWDNGNIRFFSGGEKQDKFEALFDTEELTKQFKELGHDKVIVYGEAYGGKCQGMSDAYGKELKFIVFDILISHTSDKEYKSWLSVPKAENVAQKLRLEFVPYIETTTELADLDKLRDSSSEVAKRRGIQEDKQREGIVLRPFIEVTTNNGKRIIAKYKGDDFKETSTARKVVDPAKVKIMQDAQKIADEWVTPMRLQHLLSKMSDIPSIEQTGDIIKLMIEDIERESVDETVITTDAKRCMGRATALMFKTYLKKELHKAQETK